MTIVVDGDGQGIAADCNAPASAIPTISAAIGAAANGDTVLVCPGTYVENIDFGGKAITVQSESGPSLTIIDGNAAGSVVTFASGEGLTSVLDGFTIRNGRAGSDTPAAGRGGGIRIANASPTIRGNAIIDNRGCTGVGIAVYFGSPLIETNTIGSNSVAGCSGGRGGGIDITGESTALLRGNGILSNTVDAFGGGISLFAAGTPVIERNLIAGNGGGSQGGGIWIVNDSDAVIIGNVIASNTAGSGGGVYWLVPSGATGPQLLSNTIADNYSLDGAGIFADGYDAGAGLWNNIIVAPQGQQALVCGSFNDLNPPTMYANDVFSPTEPAYGGTCLDQTGINANISTDPVFADPEILDYRLLPGSPAIDAGFNAAPSLLTLDFEGDPRVRDGDGDGTARVDIGADEAPVVAGPAGTITGTVTDGVSPLDGLTVQIFTSAGAFAKSSMTSVSGVYTVTGLPTGSYRARTYAGFQPFIDKLYDDIECFSCTVSSGNPIAVAAGATTAGINFVLEPAATITGEVTDAASGFPMNGVTLQLYTSTGALARTTTTTTVGGGYTFTGLPAGTYYVRTVLPASSTLIDEIYDDIPCLNCQPLGGTPIVVAAGATVSGIDFALSQGGVITGFVRDGTTFTGLTGVIVRFYTSTGAFAKDAFTSPGGFYSLTGLPSGTYYARTFVPGGSNHVDELFDNIACPVSCTITNGTPIVINGVSQSFVAFDLAAVPPLPQVMTGRGASFTLTSASDLRWASTEVVAGRSYCARLSPDISEVNAATATVQAFRVDGTTPMSTLSATHACFVAPFTESALLRVTQTDTTARSYRLSVDESTLWANWFFIGGDYSSYTLLKNTTAADVHATITWRNQMGDFAGSALVTVPPYGIAFRDTRGMVFGVNAGSVEVAHDGEPQALVGSQTTLSPTSGLSFDTVLRQRGPH